jgi:hypothetical protein
VRESWVVDVDANFEDRELGDAQVSPDGRHDGAAICLQLVGLAHVQAAEHGENVVMMLERLEADCTVIEAGS